MPSGTQCPDDEISPQSKIQQTSAQALRNQCHTPRVNRLTNRGELPTGRSPARRSAQPQPLRSGGDGTRERREYERRLAQTVVETTQGTEKANDDWNRVRMADRRDPSLPGHPIIPSGTHIPGVGMGHRSNWTGHSDAHHHVRNHAKRRIAQEETGSGWMPKGTGTSSASPQ